MARIVLAGAFIIALIGCQRVARGPVAVFRNSFNGVDLLMHPTPLRIESGGDFIGNPAAARLANGDVLVAIRDRFGLIWLNRWRLSDWSWKGWSKGGAVSNQDPAIAAVGGNQGVLAIVDREGGYWLSGFDSAGGDQWLKTRGAWVMNPGLAVCGEREIVMVAGDAGGRVFEQRSNSPTQVRGEWRQIGDGFTGRLTALCAGGTVYVATRKKGGAAGFIASRVGQEAAWIDSGKEPGAADPSIAITSQRVYLVLVDSEFKIQMNQFPRDAVGAWGQWQYLGEQTAYAAPAVWKDDVIVFLRYRNNLVAWWRQSDNDFRGALWGSLARDNLVVAPAM